VTGDFIHFRTILACTEILERRRTGIKKENSQGGGVFTIFKKGKEGTGRNAGGLQNGSEDDGWQGSPNEPKKMEHYRSQGTKEANAA